MFRPAHQIIQTDLATFLINHGIEFLPARLDDLLEQAADRAVIRIVVRRDDRQDIRHQDIAARSAQPVAPAWATHAFQQPGTGQGLKQGFDATPGQTRAFGNVGCTDGAIAPGVKGNIQHDENCDHGPVAPEQHIVQPCFE